MDARKCFKLGGAKFETLKQRSCFSRWAKEKRGGGRMSVMAVSGSFFNILIGQVFTPSLMPMQLCIHFVGTDLACFDRIFHQQKKTKTKHSHKALSASLNVNALVDVPVLFNSYSGNSLSFKTD